jgi:hypothetical protein
LSRHRSSWNKCALGYRNVDPSRMSQYLALENICQPPIPEDMTISV